MVRHALRGLGHRVVREFAALPLLAIEASPDALRMLEAMRGVVGAVHEDRLFAPALTRSSPIVEAPSSGKPASMGGGR